MKVTWTNNVRNTLINKEDKRKKQEKKKTPRHFSPASQSQVADKTQTVVTHFDFDSSTNVEYTKKKNVVVKYTKKIFEKAFALTKKKNLRRSTMKS